MRDSQGLREHQTHALYHPDKAKEHVMPSSPCELTYRLSVNTPAFLGRAEQRAHWRSDLYPHRRDCP